MSRALSLKTGRREAPGAASESYARTGSGGRRSRRQNGSSRLQACIRVGHCGRRALRDHRRASRLRSSGTETPGRHFCARGESSGTFFLGQLAKGGAAVYWPLHDCLLGRRHPTLSRPDDLRPGQRPRRRWLSALPRLIAATVPLAGAVLAIADRLEPVSSPDLRPAPPNDIRVATAASEVSAAPPPPSHPTRPPGFGATTDALPAAHLKREPATWAKMRPRPRPANHLLPSMSSGLSLSPRPRPRPAANRFGRRAPFSSPRPKRRNAVAIAISRGSAVPTELIAAVNATASASPSAPSRITAIVGEAHALIGNPPRSFQSAHELACRDR